MERNAYSYLSPKCSAVKAPEKGGHAVQANEPIPAGEVVAVWGGRIVNAAQAAELAPGFREHNISCVQARLDSLRLRAEPPNRFRSLRARFHPLLSTVL